MGQSQMKKAQKKAKKKSKGSPPSTPPLDTRLIESLNVPIFVASSSNGKIQFSNSAAEDLTGYSRKELQNKPIIDLFINDEKVKIESVLALIQLQKRGYQTVESDLRLRKQSGRKVPVDMNVNYITTKNEKVILLTLHDLTQIKQFQLDREKALKEMGHVSKLADIGRLAAGVAHELNNPLMIIQGFTENIELLLDTNKFEVDEIRAQISPILKSTQRMAKIISQMMRIVRDDDLKFVAIDMNSLVQDVLQLATTQINYMDIELEIDVNPQHTIRCDPNQVEQIIVNIVNNAIHALEEMNQKRCMRITSEQTRRDVRLHIWNNGPQIPSQIQDQIMTPFFTTKEVGKGTGLGLSVSYGIMKAHGGDMQFHSDETGTEFTLKFPIVKEMSPTPTTHAHKILIVDDEAFARQVLTNKLQNFGFEVHQAMHGQDALRKLKAHPEISCLFTDIRMPKMDGIELIKQVKQIKPSMVIYAITGFKDDLSLEREVTGLGVHGYLGKPIDNNSFSELIKQMEQTIELNNKKENISA